MKRLVRTTLSGGLIHVFKPPSDSTHFTGSVLCRPVHPLRCDYRQPLMVQNGFKTPPATKSDARTQGFLRFVFSRYSSVIAYGATVRAPSRCR